MLLGADHKSNKCGGNTPCFIGECTVAAARVRHSLQSKHAAAAAAMQTVVGSLAMWAG